MILHEIMIEEPKKNLLGKKYGASFVQHRRFIPQFNLQRPVFAYQKIIKRY